MIRHLLLCAPLLAAGASHAAAECRYTELATLTIGADDRWGHPYIDAQINGKPVRMLIDTGAYKTLLTRAEIDRQQLMLTPSRDKAYGVGGQAQMFAARPDEVIIGPARVRLALFPVIEGFDYPGYGGIVGADYLLQADLEIALADKQLKFFRAEGCDDKSLAYWDVNALDVPLKIPAYDSRATIQVELNGSKLTALIDTGAAVSTVTQHAAERLGFAPAAADAQPGARLVGVNGKSRRSWIATFDSFAIGEEKIDHPRITVMEDGEEVDTRSHQMILGRDFLRAHHVLLSKRQHRFYYSYLGGPVFAASHWLETR
ncbi:retroviral-like aspartic protease family protein [Duganella sp. HH105]|uniref:retroviral-like aspartic protease family protein n=1 Tax=Duganella sp. HH105 TaxID=1781067 RepID=UPI00143A14D9|nr:retroviral-like aspartic protease family protein [Duganella sp. HH105]